MKTVTLLLSLSLISTAFAQSTCSDPHFRQLDFWLGEWVVYNAKGQHAGDSRIEIAMDSCVIMENWKSAQSYNEKSFNSFNTETRLWRQTWIDNTGTYVDFFGTFDDTLHHMRLTAAPKAEKGKMAVHRMTFTPMSRDKVRQHGERSENDGVTWVTEFDLYYHRKSTVADLKPLYWLVGSWTLTRNGRPTGDYEVWESVNDSLFRGKSFSLSKGDTSIHETLELSLRNDTMFYIPTTMGQNNNAPVPFRLTKQEGTGWTFENPAHDFPKSIHYELIGKDTLYAYIGGNGRKMDFHFVRNPQFERFELEEDGVKYTMRKFWLLTYHKGDNRNHSKEEVEKIQAGHMAHLNDMYNAGKSCIAGPTEGEEEVRGFVVYTVATREEAEYLAALDPAVKAGRLKYDIVAWWAMEGSVLK